MLMCIIINFKLQMENTRIITVCNEEYLLSSRSDILAPFPSKIRMKPGCVSMRLMYYVACHESVHKWKQKHPSNAIFSCYELHMNEWLFGVLKIISLIQKFITGSQQTLLLVNSVSKTMKFIFITGPPGSTTCILIMEGATRFRP